MRRGDYDDPAKQLERKETATCRGCPHAVIPIMDGAQPAICGAGKRYGKRCDMYCKTTRKDMNLHLDDIDTLLVDYYEWSEAYREPTGYSRVSASCRGFRSNRRQWMDYDEVGEEIQAQLKADAGRAVEPIVLALPLRERIAVTTALRNIIAGSQVWRNPRYPETQARDYARAKEIMRPMFERCGLLVRCKAA